MRFVVLALAIGLGCSSSPPPTPAPVVTTARHCLDGVTAPPITEIRAARCENPSWLCFDPAGRAALVSKLDAMQAYIDIAEARRRAHEATKPKEKTP